MGEPQIQQPFSLPPPPPPPWREDYAVPVPSAPTTTPPPPPFDPRRMIGMIRRKAMIKEFAAAYHAECLTYCQELLELQNNIDEPFTDIKFPVEPRKEALRPPKRLKKGR